MIHRPTSPRQGLKPLLWLLRPRELITGADSRGEQLTPTRHLMPGKCLPWGSRAQFTSVLQGYMSVGLSDLMLCLIFTLFGFYSTFLSLKLGRILQFMVCHGVTCSILFMAREVVNAVICISDSVKCRFLLARAE